MTGCGTTSPALDAAIREVVAELAPDGGGYRIGVGSTRTSPRPTRGSGWWVRPGPKSVPYDEHDGHGGGSDSQEAKIGHDLGDEQREQIGHGERPPAGSYPYLGMVHGRCGMVTVNDRANAARLPDR